MKREVVLTQDGSSSILIPEMDEQYHSSHGAIQEAEHVFLRHGLEHIDLGQIRVFELGFGTGLNALLTCIHGQDNDLTIIYDSIEAFPVEDALIRKLNYVDQIKEVSIDLFGSLHSCNWDEDISISDRFKLRKIHAKIAEYTMPKSAYDLIYYDAFGPRAQSEMWHIPVLQKMYDSLIQGGFLVTYCAQGQFKRNLKQIGFEVESLPGPPGKREMTRAFKR